MCLAREQWNKHKISIEWFYKQSEGTKIWTRPEDIIDWCLISCPNWHEDYIYIINDEYAEIRKAIADGKEIEIKLIGFEDKWVRLEVNNPNRKFDISVEYYRIKQEIKFPIYKKNDFMVVKWLDDYRYEIIFIFNKEKAFQKGFKNIGEIINLKYGGIDTNIYDKQWKEVLYDEERKLWDGQPIWCWDEDDGIDRMLCFYDAKYKCTFKSSGNRNGFKTDFYEAYPYLYDEWVVKIYNKLDFDG